MAMQSVVLTEEVLAEEAGAATEWLDAVATAGVRRRFDRQVGLLRALPEGWRVERRPETVAGLKVGHRFLVRDSDGVTKGEARTDRTLVSWPGIGSGPVGKAWAGGIALLFAATDAEHHAAQLEANEERVDDAVR